MNADTLQPHVRAYFIEHADALDLDPATLSVKYVLNWGGFVNYSYHVHDARCAYHLKLSTTADGRRALRRWRTLEPLLERHQAPPILDWIDIGSAGGLLFPHLPGGVPSCSPTVVSTLASALRRLTADIELAAALPQTHPPTAHEAYRATFLARAVDDLHGIRQARPPFVDAALLEWLEDEVDALAQSVASAAAFGEPLTKPTHGDLWLHNILWRNPWSWYLVDWDDLSIGDPAADVATLLGPTIDDPRPLKMLDAMAGVLSPTESERLNYLGRATLLDWVIDPISDWLDAVAVLDRCEAVRAEKERIHRRALDCYRTLYG